MAAPNPYTIYASDFNGDLTRTGLWVGDLVIDPDTLDPLLLKLEGISAGHLYRHAIGNKEILVTSAPTSNPYDVADKVRLQFTDEFGNDQFIVLPAPQAGIFLADGETVDPADLSVIALVAQIIIDLVGRGGEALVTFVSGRRIRRQRRA